MRLGETVLRVVLSGVCFGAAWLCEGEARAEEAPAKQADSPSPEPPPRPPPIDLEEPPPSPRWERHIDAGVDVGLITRLASTDTDVRYEQAFGYGIHGRIDIVRYLRFTGYYLASSHAVALPPGALGLSGDLSMDSVSAFSFGARLAPMWPLSERARLWISGGVGWGRLDFGRMEVKEPHAPAAYLVRDRSFSFVEIPVGVGASIEIIRRWLAVEIEVTGAFVVGEGGSAVELGQAIDTAGKIRSVGALPALDASFAQTIGLSLIL
jgi:hypothetical protein